MAYITIANANGIVFGSDLESIDVSREVYKIPIHFFNRYERNALLAIQELLEDPQKYFDSVYVPHNPVDSLKYVYEGLAPCYHKYSCCPRLASDYLNYEIPEEIRKKGNDTVLEYRKWFKSVTHLLEDKQDQLRVRLFNRWGIKELNIITRNNSGVTIVENFTIEEIETEIDNLIKSAGRFYYNNQKNKIILGRFSKRTHLAYKEDDIPDNDTEYSSSEIKELLLYFDSEFKKPTKKYLLEYYRLKLNPEIEMDGSFLECLGFKQCGYCHKDDYRPNIENLYPEISNEITKQRILDVENELRNIYKGIVLLGGTKSIQQMKKECGDNSIKVLRINDTDKLIWSCGVKRGPVGELGEKDNRIFYHAIFERIDTWVLNTKD